MCHKILNILSQILNYETKNLFIDDILEKIKAKLTNAILSILTNFSKNRYIKSFLNLQKEVNNLIIELIIDFVLVKFLKLPYYYH